MASVNKIEKKPLWLKVKLPGGNNYVKVKELVRNGDLHTVCESAHCPNIGECWSRFTATFMIMGEICTRNCGFCAVKHGKVRPLDAEEPKKIAKAVRQLELKYAVITSVTRDDLPDGGAHHFAQTIKAIVDMNPGCKVEVLIPDFKGGKEELYIVLDAQPDVLNHNIETVPRLYEKVRPQAQYNQSIELLRRAYDFGAKTKSGLMLGLGETIDEVKQVMIELNGVGCKMLTIGQYLQPTKNHLAVDRYISPDEFRDLKHYGIKLGFVHIEAGPLVRSSYHADMQFQLS